MPIITFIDGQALSAAQLNTAFGAKIDANSDASTLTAVGGTGTTARSLQNRFADTVNVLDFLNNPPDGNADNTAQAQLAINSASNRARVYFPAQSAVYSINSLTIPSNSHIVVDGTLQQRAGSTGSLFKLNNGATNVIIEGAGVLDGQKAVQTTTRYGVETAGGSNVVINGLAVQNFLLGPWFTSNTTNVLVEDVFTANNNQAGQFTNGTNNAWVRDSTITNSTNDGLLFYGNVFNSGVVRSSVSAASGHAISVFHDTSNPNPCHDLQFTANLIYGNGKWGISIDKAGGATSNHSGILINNNRFYGNNTTNALTGGINNNTGVNVQIAGNQIARNGAGSLVTYAIRVAGPNTQVISNQIIDEGQGSTSGVGVFLVNTANNTQISSNQFIDDQGTHTMAFGLSGNAGTGVRMVDNSYTGMLSANNNVVANVDTVVSDNINLSNAAITSGTVNGTAIGGTTPAPGTFTNLVATTAAIVPTRSGGDNSQNAASTAFVAAAMVSAGAYNAGAVAIIGGTIDGTTVGATTPSTGVFSGLTAPTRTPGDSTTNVATTAFIATSFAPIASPTLTGTVTIPTATVGDSTTKAASTAFVATSFAPIASPTLTGTPAAPTAAPGTGTTQLATCAFVAAAVVAGGAYNPASVAITGGTINGTTIGGTVQSTGAFSALTAPTRTAGDSTTNVATTAFIATSFAPIASPTLTGTPAAPTAGAGTNTTQLATCAFVATSFAPIASPTFTGTPLAPTAGAGTNTTQLATTAFVAAAVAAGGSYNAASVTITGGSINGTSIGGTSPNTGAFSALTCTGSEISAVRVVTAAGAVTMLATDRVIVVNKTSGAATTVNLVSSPATGLRLSVKDGKGDANSNLVTIVPAAGTIDGQTSVVLSTAYASVDLVYNGVSWNIL